MQDSSIQVGADGFVPEAQWLPKREIKRRAKLRIKANNEQRAVNQALELKKASLLPDIAISRRLKKSLYWVRKTLGKKASRSMERSKRKIRQAGAGGLQERARNCIAELILNS